MPVSGCYSSQNTLDDCYSSQLAVLERVCVNSLCEIFAQVLTEGSASNQSCSSLGFSTVDVNGGLVYRLVFALKRKPGKWGARES